MPQAESSAAAIYRRLLRYARPHWWIVAAAIVPASIYAAIGSAFPALMTEVFRQLQDTARSAENAWQIPLGLVVLFALRCTMDFLTVYGLAWVGRSAIRELRGEVFSHYLGLPARYFDQGSSGALISRLTYNTEMISEAISNAIVILLRDTLAIILYIAVMIWYSPRLTLTVVVIGPVIALVIGAMSRAFRRYSTRIQHSMGDVTKLAEQSLHGHRVVKVFEGQDQERHQFHDVNTRNFRFNTRLVAVQAMGDALTQFAVALGVAAVMYLSFSELDAPEFIGFITAMGMLLTPLKRLINVNAVVQRGIAAASGVFEVLDQPQETDTGTVSLDRARGEVSYRNVSFRYESGKDRALRSVTLDVPAGKTVALVGQSGSGKTTLVSLLPRFYDPGRAPCCSTGATFANTRSAICAVRSRSSVRTSCCSTTRSRITSRMAGSPSARARTSSAPPRPRTSRSSRRPCRKASTRESGSAVPCCRAGSGSASRSRVLCSRTRPR
jgi:subfamily B ATP-binding cassette protein MsbA